MLTIQGFYQSTLGKAIDYDGAYGAQCVDAFKVFCAQSGIGAYPTPNNWADGYWYSKQYHPQFVAIDDYHDFKNGDWVIWAYGSASHPRSHIGMYLNGMCYGQNQGGANGAFNLVKTNFADALGALRWEGWADMAKTLSYGYSVQTVGNITAKIYRSKHANGYMPYFLNSGAFNELKAIAEFDSDAISKDAVINCGYFQMQKNQADAYGTHYGVEQDSRSGNAYTQAPKSAGLLVFYIDKNEECHVTTSDKYWDDESTNLLAFTPYAVRIHEGKLTYYRSTSLGDKDDIKNTQSALFCLDGDWCVANFSACCPRDTVTFLQGFGNVTELCLMDSGGSAQMRALTQGSVKLVASGDGRRIANAIALAIPVQTKEELKEDGKKEDEIEQLNARVLELETENDALRGKVASLEKRIEDARKVLDD